MLNDRPSSLTKFHRSALFFLVFVVFVLTFFRTAWISDDAAITLRTVLNFVHGYGPVFNVDERVQGYTHPLWFLLIAALTWLLGSPYLAVHLLSFVLGLMTLAILLCAGRRDFWKAILAVAALLFSKAFIDYSTSGLENPLAHLLVLMALLVYRRATQDSELSGVRIFFLLCSLAFLTRPDLVVILAPFAIHLCWQIWRRRSLKVLLGVLLLGALPALVWMSFSLVYYGYPFPNTAYAKLGAGIALQERISQSGFYFLDSLQRDPISLGFITIFLLQALLGAHFSRLGATAVTLYLLYVVSIGGDFMSGRFFTLPLVLSAFIFALEPTQRSIRGGVSLLVLVLAGLGLGKTLLSGSAYHDKRIGSGGIADERGYYFQVSGLIRQGATPLPLPEWREGARTLRVQCGEMGFEGIKGGPSLHIIDPCALVDPLLARLPAQYDPSWRVGHLHRQLPTNYEKSVAQNVNRLSEPKVHALYDQVRLLTRGPLFSSERWRAIYALNIGRVDPALNFLFRYASIARDTGTPIVTMSAFEESAGVHFDRAVEVAFPPGAGVYWLDLAVDKQAYEVSLLVNGTYVPSAKIPAASDSESGLREVRIQLDIPMKTARMRVVGLDGGNYHLQSVRLNEP